MTAPNMSTACKSYIRSMIAGDRRSAFRQLSMLDDRELFRGLDAPDRSDIESMFRQEPEPPPAFSSDIPGIAANMPKGPMGAALSAAAMGGQVLNRISEMTYAYQVVRSGKLGHLTAPSPQASAWARDYVHHCVGAQQIPLELDEDLTRQLPAANSNPTTLTDDDFTRAATTLHVDVPAIRAVAQVESAGSGFGDDGRPIIRFELHRFQAKTHRHFHASHPYLSQATLAAGNPYHDGSQDREYTLLYNAMIMKQNGSYTIAEAIESASWGKFQIMGENWSGLGWSSALQFASDMYVSEANHLDAFVKFVQWKGLTGALRHHNWAGFAAGYNGANYAVNHYDTNLQRAFHRFSRAAAGTHP